MNRSGRPVADLRTAINRIGYNMVRSASISFAMAQIRNANKLAGLEHYLDDLWQRSTLVAAFAFVLARACSRINPDEAMLGGMMHGIGKLYILTRATNHPKLFTDSAILDGIIDDWHASIGKAILENWVAALEVALPALPATQRLGLDEAKRVLVMRDCAAEVAALSNALG